MVIYSLRRRVYKMVVIYTDKAYVDVLSAVCYYTRGMINYFFVILVRLTSRSPNISMSNSFSLLESSKYTLFDDIVSFDDSGSLNGSYF